MNPRSWIDTMPVRICVAIRERTTEAAVSAAMRASEWADLVEIRADYIRNLDIRRLLREKPCPIIFTLRGRSEGGVFSGPEKSRLEILLRAAEEGADYEDVEFSAVRHATTVRVSRVREGNHRSCSRRPRHSSLSRFGHHAAITGDNAGRHEPDGRRYP